MVSKFLQWEIIKNNNAFIMKRPNVRTLSREPGNLRNIHGFAANGIIHKKTLDIQPGKDNKGIVVTRRKVRNARFPAKQRAAATMNSGPRRVLWKLARSIVKDGYRRNLKKAAVRRASAILQSQRSLKKKQKNAGKPKK